MFKHDFEILVTGFFVFGLLSLINFDATAKNVADFATVLQNTTTTEQYKQFVDYKKSEKQFWAQVKGKDLVSGDISDLLQVKSESGPEADLKKARESNGSFVKFVEKKDELIQPPVKFLLVGDSMMLQGFGPALENSLLSFRDVSVVREGMYSTGLNRIDYYNWYARTDELVAEHNPDIIIMMMGANDGQDIVDTSGNVHQLGDQGWEDTYRERVYQYLLSYSERVKMIYIVGHPIAGTENFTWKFGIMNNIYKTEAVKFPNVVYVDSWERFSVNGAFSQSIPDDNGLWQIAKASDGVHVTDFGGGILSNLVIKEVLKYVNIVDKNTPVPTPTPEEGDILLENE